MNTSFEITGVDVFMIDFNSTTYNFADQLKSLNDKLDLNFSKMENLNSKSTTYQKLYNENEEIVEELTILINKKY